MFSLPLSSLKLVVSFTHIFLPLELNVYSPDIGECIIGRWLPLESAYACLPVYRSICLSACLSICVCACVLVCVHIYMYVYKYSSITFFSLIEKQCASFHTIPPKFMTLIRLIFSSNIIKRNRNWQKNFKMVYILKKEDWRL